MCFVLLTAYSWHSTLIRPAQCWKQNRWLWSNRRQRLKPLLIDDFWHLPHKTSFFLSKSAGMLCLTKYSSPAQIRRYKNYGLIGKTSRMAIFLKFSLCSTIQNRSLDMVHQNSSEMLFSFEEPYMLWWTYTKKLLMNRHK